MRKASYPCTYTSIQEMISNKNIINNIADKCTTFQKTVISYVSESKSYLSYVNSVSPGW